MKIVSVFFLLFLGIMFTWCNKLNNSSARTPDPAVIDSLCEKDNARAKKDFAKGKIVYCHPFGFGSSLLRQEKQLKTLCTNSGLVFEYELFSDEITEGQSQGCYGDFMDNKIAAKYGAGFKGMLLRKADSLLAISNDTVHGYLCDQIPQIIGESYARDRVLSTQLTDSLRNKLITDAEGKFPFIDLTIILDKQGIATGYFMDYFYDAHNETNKQFKIQLARLGVTEVKKYKWTPGTVMGYNVNTQVSVRMHFY